MRPETGQKKTQGMKKKKSEKEKQTNEIKKFQKFLH